MAQLPPLRRWKDYFRIMSTSYMIFPWIWSLIEVQNLRIDIEKKFHYFLKTQLAISLLFHPQIDDQIDVNTFFEDVPSKIIGQNLVMVEFAHNILWPYRIKATPIELWSTSLNIGEYKDKQVSSLERRRFCFVYE